jgi:hypothetical protein
MPRLSDTTPEADRVLAEVYRRMTPERKWRILREELRRVRLFFDVGYHRRNPGVTPQQARRDWLAAVLGPMIPLPQEGPEVSTVDVPIEQLQTLRDVTAAFNRLGMAYVLGGSIASTLHGTPRETRDADVSVDPFPGLVSEFVSCFGDPYYISEDAVRRAIAERSSFNIITTETGFKVDVFVLKGRSFDRSLLERRASFVVPDSAGESIQVASAEDVILLKLEWYRLGGESSDRQWGDVLGVLRAQDGRLDDAYLDRWAGELGVSDLLGKARGEAAS